MPKLEQQLLKNDLRKAERVLGTLEKEYGKASLEYQEALKRFIRLWAILKMTRSQEEFFHEVVSAQKDQPPTIHSESLSDR